MAILRSIIKKLGGLLDPLFAFFAFIGFFGVIAKRVMVASPNKAPLTNMVFRKMGYLPIQDHYYEPLTFGAIGFKYRTKVAQRLFKEEKNFDFLMSIALPEEFEFEYTRGSIREAGFNLNNGSFGSGDAEVLFYFIRKIKPKKIVEIGAGHSSLIINAALKLNEAEGDHGVHVIIEPYENPWLKELNATLIRERVEKVDFSIFESLQAGDIVFIDSSHVVRAQNDCVFEYTELLPNLAQGVVVHIHDIFTPFDYPDDWLNRCYYLWSEQYILETLLVNSSTWEILAPLSWLSQEVEKFKEICPFFEKGRLPGSRWIRKL